MKKLSILLALSLASVSSFAQMYNVYGHVQDANNNPVAGQVVTATAGNLWTIHDTTDANGDYQIDIPNTTPPNTYMDIKTYGSSCMTWYIDSALYTNQQNIQSDFTICANTTNYWTVSGTVMAGNNWGADGIVYLIEQVYDSANQTYILTAVDSTLTDTTGYYSMTQMGNYSGVLKVKAALQPASVDYANYLPTYYTSSLNWNGTGVTPVVSGVNTTANIALIAGTNTGGPAFIGGDVMQGANKNTSVGDPLAGRILILTDALNVPVAYTYSDANGHFSFPSLAYGSYNLFGDAMGRNNPSLTFTLDANHPSITTINFWENDEEFVGNLWPLSVATAPELNNVSVYPNPAVDVVNVKGLDAIDGAKTISLSGINGSVVYNVTFQQGEKVSIPVSDLSAGMYMLQIATEKGSSIYKIVK